jgi:hypothetical protein
MVLKSLVRGLGTVLLLVFGVCLPNIAPLQASALSELASQMQPRTWEVLQTNGFNDSLLTQPENRASNILGYSDNAIWDPVTRSVYFLGSAHNAPSKFIRYSEATNSWTTLTPPGIGGVGGPAHGYDHTAIDIENRYIYHRSAGESSVYKYPIDGGGWSQISSIDTNAYMQYGAALEYFPELNRLLFALGGDSSSNGELLAYNGSNWSRLSGSVSMQGLYAYAEYNDMHKVVLFGGGSNAYTINSSGNISKKSNAPVGLGVQSAVLTYDPSAGVYIVIANDRNFYSYNVATNTWKNENLPTPPLDQRLSSAEPAVWGVVATPISTYGVTMFMKYYPGGSKVYLYKHAESTGPEVDTLAPKAPDVFLVQ